MTSSAPGCVFLKEYSDSPEVELELRKDAAWNPRPDKMPAVVPPKGLSVERQWYLHEQIRPFCADDFQGMVCPLPSVPKPGSRHGTPNPESGTSPPPNAEGFAASANVKVTTSGYALRKTLPLHKHSLTLHTAIYYYAHFVLCLWL